jgi:hypothetical protein
MQSTSDHHRGGAIDVVRERMAFLLRLVDSVCSAWRSGRSRSGSRDPSAHCVYQLLPVEVGGLAVVEHRFVFDGDRIGLCNLTGS